MRFAMIISILAMLAPAASAQSFRAINNLQVVPLDPTSFEVIEAYGEGPRGIWCAAAEFADRYAPDVGRIYILSGRGAARSVAGRKSVVFTTNPNDLSQGPSQSVALTTRQVGVGLPVVHALQFCRDVYDRDDFLIKRF